MMNDVGLRSLFWTRRPAGVNEFLSTEDPLYRSPGKLLLDAILENNPKEVEALLQHGVDPNFTLGLMIDRSVSSTQTNEHDDGRTRLSPESNNDYWANMDKVFLWKKFFGDTPTPVHVAVLNVYHQGQYRSALARALQILELLLKYGGDVSFGSHNIFLRPDRLIETNPLDLATGIQRMAMMSMLEKAETAILKAADIMRSYVNENKGQGKKHRIPFELVSLVSLEETMDFLYVNQSRRKPSSSSSLAIKVITSDGSRMLIKDHQNGEKS